MSDIRAVKRNISMQHWAAIIADRNTTDLTVKEYCTRNNLSRNSYFYWLTWILGNVTWYPRHVSENPGYKGAAGESGAVAK